MPWREVVLERRDERERLEGRAGLPDPAPREVELVTLVVLAGEHRLDRAVGRAHRDERDVRALLRRVDERARVHRVLCVVLPARVERRVDLQSTLVQGPHTSLARLPEVVELAVRVLEDQVADVVDEERLDLLLEPADVVRDPEGFGLRALDVVRLRPAELGHPIQDEVAALECGIGPRHRVVFPRRPDQSGEERRLRERQVLRLGVEVRVRRGLDPVGAVPEVDLVDVPLEDLFLRVPALEADRERRLLELARERLLGHVDQHVLHELLRQGGAALLDVAGREVRDRRAHQGGEVQRAVLVERVVLDRQHREFGDVGDLAELDEAAVLVEEDLRQDGSVRREDRRALRRERDPHAADAGLVETVAEGVHADARGAHDRQQDEREQRREADDHQDEQDGHERSDHPARAKFLGAFDALRFGLRDPDGALAVLRGSLHRRPRIAGAHGYDEAADAPRRPVPPGHRAGRRRRR